jgi:hypothetical protein
LQRCQRQPKTPHHRVQTARCRRTSTRAASGQ